MSDFTHDPEAAPELEPSQLALVEVGHDFREEQPPSRGAPTTPPAYAPCGCGVHVLHGVTLAGERLTLDPAIPTWAVVWGQGAATPTLLPSRGYPEHRCHKGGDVL